MTDLPTSPSVRDVLRFHIGTMMAEDPVSEGIYTGTLDQTTGLLGPLTLAVPAANPTFIARSPDGCFLYSTLGEDHDQVGAYAIQARGLLRPLGSQSSQGAGVCHLSLDGTGRHLFVANYSSGSIAGFPLGTDGRIGLSVSQTAFQGSGPNANRQTGPHAHSIYASPDNGFVYSCDLGTDRLWIFRFDAATGVLTPADPPFATLPPGSGPRHLAFGAGGSRVYVANELDCTVTVFSRDAITGALTALQTVSSLPPALPLKGSTSAEIALHPGGRWLYVSIREVNTFAIFEVREDGRIDLVQSASAGVRMPRHFAIDPSGRWLLVAGQEDHRLAVLRIDPTSGELAVTGAAASVRAPVCVVFDNEIRSEV